MSVIACVTRKGGIEPIVDDKWCLIVKENKQQMLSYLKTVGEVERITNTMYHLKPFIKKIDDEGMLIISLFRLDMFKF